MTDVLFREIDPEHLDDINSMCVTCMASFTGPATRSEVEKVIKERLALKGLL